MLEYEVIDNFLKEDDFNKLLSLKLKKVKSNQLHIYHNVIFKDGKVELDCLDNAFIQILFNNYHNIAIRLLKKFNPKKVSLYEYSDFSLIETGSNYKFPIHLDNPTKLLSGVIYLSPKYNTGTVLYDDKDGKNKKIIEWKQNRALFFSRNEHEPYHSYQGDGKNNRLALIYNLRTTNIRGVCKAENANYLKVKFKELLNPYLYRFFKKII
jgi:hypothetical protein|tara:strand:+ start:2523 stop:3152 length:630 start_codon:yes stop_codon:yes gene_type:complete